MNELVDRIKQKMSGYEFLILGIFAVLVALGIYGYMGIFSRYTSDDYCLTAFFYQGNDLASNMISRYNEASSRYTNILFIGLADKLLGWYNPAILPALMLALLVFGLYLFLNQIQITAQLGWGHWPSFYLAALIAYLSLVQAPNLYETLYWRAGMTSHFAPVALLPFLGAFAIKQIRLASERIPSAWIYAACFVIPFLIGGLSEPPATLMITVLVLAIAAVWWWLKTPERKSILLILFWILAGALTALVVLALAPANSIRLGDTEKNLFVLAWKIFYSTLQFVIDDVRTFPLPAVFSILIPALLFYIRSVRPEKKVSPESQKRLALLIPIVLLISYILIASSFAPSVYGQSYPSGRARFPGVVLLSCAFMTTGALLGILMANRRMMVFQSPVIQTGLLLIFVVLSLYPLRTAWRVSRDVPTYQQRAVAWDKRDVMIRSLKDQGIGDLTVPFLKKDIQDLGDHREYRLNRCASRIYGVNSILAIPMKQQ